MPTNIQKYIHKYGTVQYCTVLGRTVPYPYITLHQYIHTVEQTLHHEAQQQRTSRLCQPEKLPKPGQRARLDNSQEGSQIAFETTAPTHEDVEPGRHPLPTG